MQYHLGLLSTTSIINNVHTNVHAEIRITVAFYSKGNKAI